MRHEQKNSNQVIAACRPCRVPQPPRANGPE
jgi:hypothetical protein